MSEDADTEFYSSFVLENSGSSQSLLKQLQKILKSREEVVLHLHFSAMQLADEFMELEKIKFEIDRKLTKDDRCFRSEIPI